MKRKLEKLPCGKFDAFTKQKTRILSKGVDVKHFINQIFQFWFTETNTPKIYEVTRTRARGNVISCAPTLVRFRSQKA